MQALIRQQQDLHILKQIYGNNSKIKFIIKNLLLSHINSYSIFQLIKITFDFKNQVSSFKQSNNQINEK